ncbi:SWAHB protein, partial [Trogon melanurus]|nr:SWAHB protein [Trogon melanurus]
RHRRAAPSTEYRLSRSMARELSQEAVLDFLWEAGGRAPNTALLRHFQRFLRDPALTEQQRRERREYFKSLVNSLATVHPAAVPGASKDIVLRRRLPQSRSPQQPRTGMLLLKAPPPSAGPRGRPPTGSSQSPLLSSGPRVVPLPRSAQALLAEPPPSRSRLLLSDQGVLPLSRSLQALPASPSPSAPLLPDLDVLPSSQSRSLQQLPTRAPPSPPRESQVLTLNKLTRLQSSQLHSHKTLPLPSDPGVLPPARPPPSQSPPQSLTLPPPSQSLQPPAARTPTSQSLLPAQGPAGSQVPESNPPAPLPVFKSIRCQLALLEVQGIPQSLPDDGGQQPRTLPSKSSPRNVPNRGLSVPLGQREHAWLVAVSAGCWAQVRGLFLEEPELALQRDFMSGFTVLHWLAKHGDGPGLQELAAAARQTGLTLDVDARSGCGYTPLHLAAIHGHQFVIKVLVLQLGCQVQVRDSSGRQPWEYLGSSTSGEIWQLLEAP